MKIPNIRPRKKQVLVKPDEAKAHTSKHGIIAPSTEEAEPKAIGTVVAIGSDIFDIKVDDRIIYGMFAGEPISFEESTDKVDLILLFDEDILAFIED